MSLMSEGECKLIYPFVDYFLGQTGFPEKLSEEDSYFIELRAYPSFLVPGYIHYLLFVS